MTPAEEHLMTPGQCVDLLNARGVPAELRSGVPFIPAEKLPTLEEKRCALEACQAIGVSMDIFAEGAFLCAQGGHVDELGVFETIAAERREQDERWGAERHLDLRLWTTVLAEEFGEVARAVLENNPEELRRELVQVAAVCVAWLESGDGQA